jgi:hypothetical protein
VQIARGNLFLQTQRHAYIRNTKYTFMYIYKEKRVYMRLLGLSMLVLQIINKHILQMKMQLFLILSYHVYSYAKIYFN